MMVARTLDIYYAPAYELWTYGYYITTGKVTFISNVDKTHVSLFGL